MRAKGTGFVGLAGLGYWGKNILRNLREMGVLHTACDPDAGTVAQRRKDFPDVRYTYSFEELLGDPAITGIVIATPAATHYRMVERSLLAGKDVLVEKPLALTAKEGERPDRLAESEKKVLMVGHILHYHPAVIRLRELIASGELGKVQYIYSNRLNIGKLRTEENILWSFAPHDISVMLMLLGEEPEEVSASGGAYLNSTVYDTTLTSLSFKSGVRGHIFVSWLHPYKEQKLIVVGSKAMVVFDDTSDEKLFYYPHRITWKDGRTPVALPAKHEVIPCEKTEPLRQELLHFIECAAAGKRPLTDGKEGLKVLKVLEAAERSLSSTAGKRPGPWLQDFFVHDSACVDEGVIIGRGTKVWHFSHLLRDSTIGEGCIIGQNVTIGPEVTIGDRCKIQNNVSVYTGVMLEDEVFCGPSCVFTDVYNPRAFIERKHEFRQTIVKKGATVGANATIVCGVTIGRYAMIGAGSVVKADVPDYAVVAGVPARQVGWTCKCGNTLRFEHEDCMCSSCGNMYRLQDGMFEAVKER